jgi:hypothetical protein
MLRAVPTPSGLSIVDRVGTARKSAPLPTLRTMTKDADIKPE